jgi:hypothetical protein
MKKTFAGKVRVAAEAIQKSSCQVTCEALEAACEIGTRKERDRLYDTIGDFCRRGEMQRVKRGVYRYAGRQKSPEKQQVMWRYLRSSRSFGGVTMEELREVAGASVDYVLEWLAALVTRGVVKSTEGDPTRWQLLHDPIEMPENDEKAERLRALRAKKRNAALDALARAKSAIVRAENFILEDSE